MNPYEPPQTPNTRAVPEIELPRQERNPGAVKSATILFASAILVVNALIVFVAAGMDGWGAMATIMIYGPALNLGAGVVGLCLLPGVMKDAGGSSTALYVAAVVLLPFAAMLIDGVIIRALNFPGGC